MGSWAALTTNLTTSRTYHQSEWKQTLCVHVQPWQSTWQHLELTISLSGNKLCVHGQPWQPTWQHLELTISQHRHKLQVFMGSLDNQLDNIENLPSVWVDTNSRCSWAALTTNLTTSRTYHQSEWTQTLGVHGQPWQPTWQHLELTINLSRNKL